MTEMLERKIYGKLLEWKRESQGKTALLIEGARRVGKSTIVKRFAQNEYRSYLIIDFAIASRETRELFETQREHLDTFFSYLSVLYNVTFYQRDTLIVFDEVQRFPLAREFIKYLVADGRYDYIETGSLISIKKNVEDIVIPSEEMKISMEPLDFEEFLWARDNKALADLIRSSRQELRPLPDALHRKAMQLFREYLLIGGMPQSVVEYAETKDFGKADRVKRGILELYADDVSKYAGSDAPRVRRLLASIPQQLSRHEKRLVYAQAESGTRSRDWQGPLAWLDEARIVNLCYKTTDPSVALALNVDDTALKCYMADTGLLTTQSFNVNAATPNETYKAILFGNLGISEGMLTENYVAQQLRAQGDDLYYYSSYDKDDARGNMEIDFVVVRGYKDAAMKPRVSPIGVKSSKRYQAVSLEKFRQRFGRRVGTSYILHPRQLSVEGDMVRLPLYMAFCL
ncbi:MAG: ATP-binding protein [Atopobiaceae bacterium]